MGKDDKKQNTLAPLGAAHAPQASVGELKTEKGRIHFTNGVGGPKSYDSTTKNLYTVYRAPQCMSSRRNWDSLVGGALACG
jgi:hypothetical protein